MFQRWVELWLLTVLLELVFSSMVGQGFTLILKMLFPFLKSDILILRAVIDTMIKILLLKLMDENISKHLDFPRLAQWILDQIEKMNGGAIDYLRLKEVVEKKAKNWKFCFGFLGFISLLFQFLVESPLLLRLLGLQMASTVFMALARPIVRKGINEVLEGLVIEYMKREFHEIQSSDLRDLINQFHLIELKDPVIKIFPGFLETMRGIADEFGLNND
jgi:hypothetical protein